VQKVRTLSYPGAAAMQTTQYIDRTCKLQMMNQLAAVLFKVLAGQTSTGKRVPAFVHHISARNQRIFLDAYVWGDGSRQRKKTHSEAYRNRHFRATTKSLLLAAGFSMLLKQLGYACSIQYRETKKVYTIITSDRNNARVETHLKHEAHDGYVYDLNVQDTHMFADGCGQILLHNTDSLFIDLKVNSLQEAQEIGKTIPPEVNAHLKKYFRDRYHRDSVLELQLDKIFVRFYLPMTRGGEGSKKRYAGTRVVDGKEKIEFTGLEFVRRDWTELAKEFQLGLLDRVFHKQDPTAFVKQFVAEVKAGKLDHLLVYKKAIRKELAAYTKTTPQHVKAARQLDTINGSLIESYVTVDGPQPVEKRTSAIDYAHYIEKQLKPIADAILVFYGTNFDDLVAGSTQKNLFAY
jgi:DNA polymerase elongation subunit (family B)